MPSYIPIGLGAGLAAAVLFASAVIGQTVLGFLLMFIVPLPKFLAGLGWGWRAAALAALAGTVLVAAATNVRAGLYYGLSQGLPAALLCYHVYLNRTVAEPDGTSIVEWYPMGRVLGWCAAISGILAMLFLLVIGTSAEALREQMQRVVDVFMKSLSEIETYRKAGAPPLDAAAMTEMMVNLMPAAFAGSALLGIIVNMWIAGRITLTSGRLLRPWPDLAAIELPKGAGLALAATTALSLPSEWTGVPEYPRLVASGFATALMLAYLLVGLAILHFNTRGKSWRTPALIAGYLALLFLNPWSGLAFMVAALTEPFMPWRRAPYPTVQGGPPTGPST